MESSLLGLVLESSTLINAERRGLSAAQAMRSVRAVVGSADIVLSAITIAEIGHGIYRARTPDIRARRRAFLDDSKASVPVYPVTADTAGIVARTGGELAAKGINLQFADLLIAACALEIGFAIGTTNVRDFARIPGLKVITL